VTKDEILAMDFTTPIGGTVGKFTKVIKEEFEKFIKNYPNKLDKDYNMIFEPPHLMYYDFTSGEGYSATVAYISLDSEYNKAFNDEYYIRSSMYAMQKS